jgi:hypothetical protein
MKDVDNLELGSIVEAIEFLLDFRAKILHVFSLFGSLIRVSIMMISASP